MPQRYRLHTSEDRGNTEGQRTADAAAPSDTKSEFLPLESPGRKRSSSSSKGAGH
jgi:hypothetical protein